MSARVTVQIGGVEHDVGMLIGDPNSDTGRELVARIVIEWARGYAGEEADLDD